MRRVSLSSPHRTHRLLSSLQVRTISTSTSSTLRTPLTACRVLRQRRGRLPTTNLRDWDFSTRQAASSQATRSRLRSHNLRRRHSHGRPISHLRKHPYHLTSAFDEAPAATTPDHRLLFSLRNYWNLSSRLPRQSFQQPSLPLAPSTAQARISLRYHHRSYVPTHTHRESALPWSRSNRILSGATHRCSLAYSGRKSL